MNGSRTQCPLSPRTFFPPLILIALLLALLVAATPASAYEDWEHGGAGESTCDVSGCHKDKPATSAACVQSGCHAGYTTSGPKKCWDCHAPGSAPSVSCAGSCHLLQGNGDNPSYPTAFTHGATPHLGASGYGKTCVDCHGAGNPHHDVAVGHQPTCAECHNGSIAKLPPAGHNDGKHTNCTSCHVGMNRPSGDCASCHVGNLGSAGPQIAYSNSPACGDAGCHGKVKNHVGTSISAAACTTCHTQHYKSLGACTKCHANPRSFHHGTAKATPLAACATCHDGSIAAAPKGHAGYGANCVACHTGMNRPSGDCATCHAKPRGTWPAVVSTNPLSCADARCHAKVANHSGTLITHAPCTTCHTAHYKSLGACTKCHANPRSFHHGTAKATPLTDCAGCHNGSLASAHGNHGKLKSCTPCHGAAMRRPSVPGVCITCHDVGTTTSTSCLASGCHTSTKLHAPGPAGGVDCNGCHSTTHFKAIASCTTCHPDRVGYHHRGVKTTPLADCGSCHDGKIASAKKAHAGLPCAKCHTGMARPPVPATCQDCHDVQSFGTKTCTTCHSKTGMIGKETVHATDPAATVSCTTCHKKHYQGLGACNTCHGGHAETHHGTVTLADTQLKLVARPARIKAHKKATLKGTLRSGDQALAAQSVLIQRKVKGGLFKKVAVVTTDADGRFSRVVKPRVGTVYRAVWRAAGAYVTQLRPAIDSVKLRVRK